MNTRSARPHSGLHAHIAIDGRQKYVVAALAGIAPTTLSAILHGRTEPDSRQRAALAMVLGVAETDLFDAVAAS